MTIKSEYEGKALEDLQKDFAENKRVLADFHEEAGENMDMSKVKVISGTSAEKVSKYQDICAEQTDLHDAITFHHDMREMKAANQLNNLGMEETLLKAKNIGQTAQEVIASLMSTAGGPVQGTLEYALNTNENLKAFHDGQAGSSAHLRLNYEGTFNTLFNRPSGYPPEVTRSGTVVLAADRPLEVTDLFPVITWGQASYAYMAETVTTRAAAERAEGAILPEAELSYAQVTEPVQSIGAYLPVTQEVIDDNDQILQLLRGRLGFFVRQRVDLQLIMGNGTAPNIRGLNNVTGVNTQARGADTNIDAIFKAITSIEVTGRAQPDAVILNPTNWQTIALTKTTTNEYLYGSPASTVTERIWGLPVVRFSGGAANEGWVGDFAGFSNIIDRQQMRVELGMINDDFQKLLMGIRAYLRMCAVFYRGQAFTKLTGLN